MNAYPMDLRSKVLDAVERGIPLREVAEFLGISLSTIPRYVKLRASGTEIAPKPSPRAGRRSSPRARSTGTSFPRDAGEPRTWGASDGILCARTSCRRVAGQELEGVRRVWRGEPKWAIVGT